ncbi:uncharacterized protein ASPGLDRAFT_181370 [Aspergillus glaucus CBS 516.65]|uniref:Aminotransferase class I/classII large domain-containing protein n=1 Tax=Aspergillus glaucus CBS 516.65 TaxID=1160497 RepID=A0A1L9V5H5_ASPGL|nr:hypothetical protein ASPGLDRAFT_181370 [Aspergillus glaucus CBS 516.65]OJJ79168.1 hypothetical protein ASPGLDRAFT_181370 [Aspergillus glaucus CBS 516.65]
MRSLGPGAPSTEYFPFYAMNLEVGSTNAFATVGKEAPASTTTIYAGKHDSSSGLSTYDLAIALQYGQGTGSAQLVKFMSDHVNICGPQHPPYRNWKCILSVGTTSAFEIVPKMLAKPGDYLLVEQHTYTTVFETSLPLGIKFAQVRIDKDGLTPNDLDDILTNWDETVRGSKKPSLLYTVPTGQNPCEITQPLPRRQEIYRVAQKHNLFIVEDDPYYFIQPWLYKTVNQATEHPTSVDDYVKALVPSYLSIDVDGRVLRMDPFSKIIAPGARMGRVTASEQVIERMVRAHEVSVQNPSGFSQIAVFKLLHDSWGHLGFVQWLAHLRGEYIKRRDVLFEACELFLPREICGWVPSTAGFFHNKAGLISSLQIEKEIHSAAIDAGTLVVPGSWFLPDEGRSGMDEVFFRITYAAASTDDIREAIKRFGAALRRVFYLQSQGKLGQTDSGHQLQKLSGKISPRSAIRSVSN